MLHGHNHIEIDMTRGKFLKIHTTRVSDKRVGHVSDMTHVHDRSARAT